MIECSAELPDFYLNTGASANTWLTVSARHILKDISDKQDKSVCALRIKSSDDETWVLGWPAMAGKSILF